MTLTTDLAFEFLRAVHPLIRVVWCIDCPRRKDNIHWVIGWLILQSVWCSDIIVLSMLFNFWNIQNCWAGLINGLTVREPNVVRILQFGLQNRNVLEKMSCLGMSCHFNPRAVNRFLSQWWILRWISLDRGASWKFRARVPAHFVTYGICVRATWSFLPPNQRKFFYDLMYCAIGRWTLHHGATTSPQHQRLASEVNCSILGVLSSSTNRGASWRLRARVPAHLVTYGSCVLSSTWPYPNHRKFPLRPYVQYHRPTLRQGVQYTPLRIRYWQRYSNAWTVHPWAQFDNRKRISN